MSYSPYVPSPPATPPPPTSMAYDPSPSIVQSSSVEDLDLHADPSYYASSTCLPAGPSYPYNTSPLDPRKAGAAGMSSAGTSSQPYMLQTAPVIVPTQRRKMDMNFAPSGSTAAQAGIHTPLAHYTAHMVVWLWFGKLAPPANSPPGTSLSHDPFEYPRHPSNPLHPLQVAPSDDFTRFVAQLLQITMVSHSVTLVALLYIYRLKMRYQIEAGLGTEMRPFIASLILANKYLDDNTYTNKTWAELTGLTVHEIGRMETEFLGGLEYRLSVEKSEYDIWRKLLDGFILSRSHDGIYRSRFNPDFSHSPPTNGLITPSSAYMPSQPYVSTQGEVRARSVSPPVAMSGHQAYSPLDPRQYQYHTPGHPSDYAYTYARKRSAVDAFAGEPIAPATVYESMRKPQRKTAATPQPMSSSSNGLGGGLYRSSSLNRQIARMPGSSGSSGREGSAGNMHAMPGMSHTYEPDLRHTAANHAAQLSYDKAVSLAQHQYQHQAQTVKQEVDERYWSSLIAPCDQNLEAHAIPPEQLVFYTIAATPHPGQDGAPRKAILRHQQPHPFSYPPHADPYASASSASSYPQFQNYSLEQNHTMTTPIAPYAGPSTSSASYMQRQPIIYNADDDILDVSPTAPYAAAVPLASEGVYYPAMEQTYEGYYPNHHASPNGYIPEPEPAQFANAGPPGYIYDPSMYSAYHSAVATPVPQPPGSAMSQTAESSGSVAASNRWSSASDEMVAAYNHAHGAGNGLGITYGNQQHQGQMQQGSSPAQMQAESWRATRSEWSSPMPGYHQGWKG